MTLVSDAADMLIGDFGEEVTVYPKTSDVPEDESDPIYFKEIDSSESSFTQKARVYSQPSEEMLQKYGFDEDTEAIIYERDNEIEEADEIEFGGQRYVVRQTTTNQIGSGAYIWIHDLMGL
jgi:hypothetical protein